MKAHIQSLIIEKRILETVSLTVRTCLLRTWIIRVYRNNRTIYCADSTFHALFKTCIQFLFLTHDISDLE